MTLTGEQVAEMSERGFLVFPSLFSPAEVHVIRGAAGRLHGYDGPEVVSEHEHPSTTKMIFGVHVLDDVFLRVAGHPRIVGPAEHLFGERVHLFQSRLNVKVAFRSSGWPWHQDFNQWHRLDGMRTPRAIVVCVFIDDVNPCNGPLMVIPGSQRRGHIVNPVSMEIDEEVVEAAVNEGGIVPLMGPPGTVALFDCLVIHGSATNISPWPRRILYLNFSPASNRELQPWREPYRCDTDVRPLSALADDCLLERRAPA